MKKHYLLSITLMANIILQAQNHVTLRFTAQMQGGSYHALDSVKIINESRGWEEMIYFPDTVLQMVNSTGIAEVNNQGNALLQNIPNPFNGSTEIKLQLSKQEKICLTLYDLSGKQCAVYAGSLPAGEHAFKISVGVAQAYILNLKTSEGEQSIKLSANQGGTNFQLTYTGYITQMKEKQLQKAKTENEFQTGDNMKFIGYTIYDSTKRTHQLRVSQGGTDADYTFQFAIGYAVGDVYYDESGKAEGVVCWIADTVFSDSGKYYGLYGKMISLDQSRTGLQAPYVGLMYATQGERTYAMDSVDGRVNTAIHMALCSDSSKYRRKDRLEAVRWCTNKGVGWYFPAKYEMINVLEHILFFNEILMNLEADTLNVEPTDEVYNTYWTSTERENDAVYKNAAFCIRYDTGVVIVRYDWFAMAYHVRAMKWFNEPE